MLEQKKKNERRLCEHDFALIESKPLNEPHNKQQYWNIDNNFRNIAA